MYNPLAALNFQQNITPAIVNNSNSGAGGNSGGTNGQKQASSPPFFRIADSNYYFNGMEGNACQYNLYCPNGNTQATCNIEPVFVPGPPENICRNYLHNHNIVVNGKCWPFIGKAELANFPINCN